MDESFVKDIIQWDVRNWSRALEFWERQIDWERVDTCLELGGRKGGLSLWLARKGKKVVCSDIKDTRANAHAYHAKYGLDGAIRYEDIDATAIKAIAIGFVVAFITGVIVVRYLLDFVSKRGFAPFAWWRIIIGGAGLGALAVLG